MPETLYGAGADLLRGSAQTATDITKANQAQTDTTVDAGKAASSNLSKMELQKNDAANQIRQIDEKGIADGHMMRMTPQIALGLMKDAPTDEDKRSLMQLVGQTVPTGVVLGFQKMHMLRKYSPKVTDGYTKDGKVTKMMSWIDPESGQPMSVQLGGEIEAGKLHPQGRGGGGRGGAADKLTVEQQKQFIKSYQDNQKEYDRMSSNPNIEPGSMDDKKQWLEDNRDTYDALLKSMAGGRTTTPTRPGTGAPPAPGAGGAIDNDKLFEGL